MKDSTATTSAVLNLERRLAVLEGQAAENQFNLVRIYDKLIGRRECLNSTSVFLYFSLLKNLTEVDI